MRRNSISRTFGWCGFGRELRKFTKNPIVLEDGGYERNEYAHERVYNLNDADVVISKTITEKHRLVIDLDSPHQYYPSTTEGHGHLYFDTELEWDAALEILEVLAKHGIVQEGYVKASRARGYSAVRLPWIKKAEREPKPFDIFAEDPWEDDSDKGWRKKGKV